VIEAPTDSQKHAATIAHGAQLLAHGRPVASVADQLRKRGMSSSDIEASWAEIQSKRSQIIRDRRCRVRAMGLCWFTIGFSMLAGIVWSLIMHDILPLILLFGSIPLAYGIYLLRLPPTEEPSIDPPRFFGRNP
jgi:hypothetical protein